MPDLTKVAPDATIFYYNSLPNWHQVHFQSFAFKFDYVQLSSTVTRHIYRLH